VSWSSFSRSCSTAACSQSCFQRSPVSPFMGGSLLRASAFECSTPNRTAGQKPSRLDRLCGIPRGFYGPANSRTTRPSRA
jgi:hypothetical protein